MSSVFRKGATDSLLPRCLGNPLIHHSHHFGQTIHTLCHVQALLTIGIICKTELDTMLEETLLTKCISTETSNAHLLYGFHFFRDWNKHQIFKQLLQLVPGLQDWISMGNEEEQVHIADQVGFLIHHQLDSPSHSFRRVLTVQGLIIQKASKVISCPIRAGAQPTTISECQD